VTLDEFASFSVFVAHVHELDAAAVSGPMFRTTAVN